MIELKGLRFPIRECELVHAVSEERFFDRVLTKIWPKAHNIVTPDNRQLLYVDNGADVLAIAHLDGTMKPAHFFHGWDYSDVVDGQMQYKIWSTMVDDRLGAYALLYLLPQLTGVKVDLLFSVGEEEGNPTSKFFQKDKLRMHERRYNWMFQFDRKGKDAVHYQYKQPEWLGAMHKHFDDVSEGMFSDISYMGHMGCQAMNIGTAYYDYTWSKAWANLSELAGQVRKFEGFYNEYKDIAFHHDTNDPIYLNKYGFDWGDESFFGHGRGATNRRLSRKEKKRLRLLLTDGKSKSAVN